MRRAAAKIYESKESIGTVKKIVKKAVQKKSKDLKVLNIIVTLKDDPYDDDEYYYIIMVIYDDRSSRPKKGFEIGLHDIVLEELGKNGLEPYPVFRIIPNSEYKEVKIAAA